MSQDKFAVEFEKTIEHYKIKPATAAGKSMEYNVIESAAQFILGGALDAAEKNLKSPKDLESAATFSAALCEFLGRNGGLEKSDINDLQSRVPAGVFPEAAKRVMGARAKSAFGAMVAKGIVTHGRMSGKKKGRKILAAIEGELVQFVSNRDKKYLKVLANHLDRL
ncbi:MAG: hypothetical protein HOH89_08345 [Alphaproteobacteria bacterium]|nr:hypothetical protein [Alphaproteobacteria bacterium]